MSNGFVYIHLFVPSAIKRCVKKWDIIPLFWFLTLANKFYYYWCRLVYNLLSLCRSLLHFSRLNAFTSSYKKKCWSPCARIFIYIYVYITEKLFMTLKASEEKRKFNWFSKRHCRVVFRVIREYENISSKLISLQTMEKFSFDDHFPFPINVMA